MSLEGKLQQEAICKLAGCKKVSILITPKEKSLGGFSVRRLLPSREQRMIGPWLFFDHMGPVTFPPGEGINVRPHPHIHLATVTYLFAGEILHRDSLGSLQAIKPGDINLMIAGTGIVHSERERPEVTRNEHTLHGLQLWLALPEEKQDIPPEFIHYPEATVPHVNVEGVRVRVIMGAAYGVVSPVKTLADTLYFEAHLEASQTLHVAAAEERAVYVAEGEISIDDVRIKQFQMAVLAADSNVEIVATTSARVAVIGGEKMAPRKMFWNFASTDAARIEQAKTDWQAGRFAKVPGDETEFIPLPE
ncbi:pirin family protein [Alteromonas flava]|uniref:pirin family protein n=1 Tax=Alteromonas flava TaxID=2048003 RepID=UPI000C287001|nr:pirin family protein [Alteromonas flava]